MEIKNHLELCKQGFNSESEPDECHFSYGTLEYQAWMLGRWLRITNRTLPKTLVSGDLMWVADSLEIAWLGIWEDEGETEVSRDIEFRCL